MVKRGGGIKNHNNRSCRERQIKPRFFTFCPEKVIIFFYPSGCDPVYFCLCGLGRFGGPGRAVAADVFAVGEKGDVFTHGDVVAVCVAEEDSDLGTSVALDARDLGVGVVGEGATDFFWFVAVEVEVAVQGVRGGTLGDGDSDGFLLAEVAFDSEDAGREKTGVVEEGLVGAMVDVDGSVRGEAVEEPEDTGLHGRCRGEEAGVEGRVLRGFLAGITGFVGACVFDVIGLAVFQVLDDLRDVAGD